ncbi:MAG: hypothetical protein HRU19_27950 [Pseudobacteriovorax sp.]|nr:hypothetical protein [Pseudobacteriovorax sp.]
MKRLAIGTSLGFLAACIDVSPMLLRGMDLVAISTPFLFWIVTGFMISAVRLSVHPALKGVTVPMLILLPQMIPLSQKTPTHLPVILTITLFLGAFLGWVIEWACRRYAPGL